MQASARAPYDRTLDTAVASNLTLNLHEKHPRKVGAFRGGPSLMLSLLT